MNFKKSLIGLILVALIWVVFRDSSKTEVLRPVVIPGFNRDPEIPYPTYAKASPGKQVASAQLEDFKNINSKVLLSAEEKIKLQELLSNSDLIRRSYLLLTKLISDESARLLALDYLEKSVAWQENPAREEALESLKNMMLLDNLSDIEDLNIRKSYAGDKVEAYAILKQYSPQTLLSLDSLPQEGRIRKLLKYAENLSQ